MTRRTPTAGMAGAALSAAATWVPSTLGIITTTSATAPPHGVRRKSCQLVTSGSGVREPFGPHSGAAHRISGEGQMVGLAGS
jgi:hypothetical protein